MILLLTPLLAIAAFTLLVYRWIDRRHPPQWTSMHELARRAINSRKSHEQRPR